MKKEFRVKRNEDFSKIIARKKSFANSCFIIYKDENQIGHGRVGISVSKKLGNAVTRNKIKRQLRMMIQECFHFDEEVDYIVIVRKNFLNHTYIENKKEIWMPFSFICYKYEKLIDIKITFPEEVEERNVVFE